MRATALLLIGLTLLLGYAQTRVRPEVNDLIQRGNLARQRNQNEVAVRFYRQAIEQARSLNDVGGEASALHAIGVALIAQQRSHEAVDYLKQALQHWQNLSDPICEANTLHNLGVAYTNLGKPQEALEAYRRALSLRQKAQQRYGEASTLQGIGLVYFGMYDTAQALHYFKRALEIWRDLGNKLAQAETLRYIGQLYQATGQWQSALACYEQAITYCQEVSNPALQATLLAAIASVYLTMGQPDLALNYYRQALDLRQNEADPRETVVTHLGLGHLYTRLGQTDSARAHYQKALELSQSQGYVCGEISALNALGNLLASSEPSQAESLYRQAYEKAQTVRDRLGQASAQVNLGLLYARTKRPELARPALESARALYGELGDLRGEMYALSNLGTLTYNQNDIESALQYYLQAIDRAERIRQQVGVLTEARLAFQAERQALYATTIALLARAQRTEEAFLLTQRAKARTLTDLLDAGRAGTEIEAQQLIALFPDHRLLKGAEAQEATLKAELGKYRYVHLATHGYFNDATPLQSGLVLAEPQDSSEDGILTARELMEIPLSAQMVVLPACESARGRARPGEGAMGIVWALSVSGVPVQVLSQWKESDESTALLMSRFYARLKQGMTAEVALRRAALEVRQDPRFQHPYYWAPFIRIGAF